jgi:chaperone required for assembly of F1-ATPase
MPSNPGSIPDPSDGIRAQTRSPLPKRFYRIAGMAEREGSFALTLDGRTARTPAKAVLATPTRALAEALAAEWDAQQDVIDPARMPLTRIVNSAIDGVAARMDEVRDDLVRYAGSDLVCYRAGEPERLVAAQAAAWDPILAFAREALGARFVLSQGVTFVQQPEHALAALRTAVAAETSPMTLAALHVLTTLTGSVLLALALVRGVITPAAAWAAAHVDDFFQEEFWGADHEATERRAQRGRDFDAAARVYALARQP